MSSKPIYKKVYNEIKKYNIIYLARHIGPDPDAIASQISLRDSIVATFPNKKVYALGASVAKFKYFGKLDKVDKIDYEKSLLIVLDIPDNNRVDIPEFNKFKNIIKIDHHPFVDKFSDIELVDTNVSSTCEIILELINNTKLLMTKNVAENIFMGMVSDSNRFLFENTSAETFALVSNLIIKSKIDIQELYKKIYIKPISELRLMGYIASNIKVTKNGFAYINLEDDIIKSFGADAASASNMINDLNNIKEILVWMFISRDEKNDLYRVNIRSRGPVINEIASKYNGGGHIYACGVRTKEKKVLDELISKYDELCREYEE